MKIELDADQANNLIGLVRLGVTKTVEEANALIAAISEPFNAAAAQAQAEAQALAALRAAPPAPKPKPTPTRKRALR